MDISKLPRLSQTPASPNDPAASEASPPAAEAGFPAATIPGQSVWCPRCNAPNGLGSQFCSSCGGSLVARRVPVVESGIAAEAWISIAVGVILLLMAPNLIKYLISPAAFEQSVQITDEQGQPLAYAKSVFFWGDLSLTLFAIVLIVEGLVIAFGRKAPLVLFAFVLTVTTTVLNLFYITWMMTKGYGLQIMSALAVAFGVYIALFQWRLYSTLRMQTR